RDDELVEPVRRPASRASRGPPTTGRMDPALPPSATLRDHRTRERLRNARGEAHLLRTCEPILRRQQPTPAPHVVREPSGSNSNRHFPAPDEWPVHWTVRPTGWPPCFLKALQCALLAHRARTTLLGAARSF